MSECVCVSVCVCVCVCVRVGMWMRKIEQKQCLSHIGTPTLGQNELINHLPLIELTRHILMYKYYIHENNYTVAYRTENNEHSDIPIYGGAPSSGLR